MPTKLSQRKLFKQAFQDIHTNPIPLPPPPGMGLRFWGVFVLSYHNWKSPAKSSAFCMRMMMMVMMMVHERFECVGQDTRARDFKGGLSPGCDHRQ